MILASVSGQDKLHFIKVFAKNHHTKIMYIKRNLIFSRNCEELIKSLFSLFLSNSVKTELTFHVIQRVKPFPCFSHILNTRLQSADSCSFHWRSSISANFTGLSNNGHSIQPQTLPEIYVVLNIFVLLQYLKFSSGSLTNTQAIANLTISLKENDEVTLAGGKRSKWMILDSQFIFLPLSPPSLQIYSCSIRPQCWLHYQEQGEVCFDISIYISRNTLVYFSPPERRTGHTLNCLLVLV